MASPETLDFEALVAPIAEDAPTGGNLRDDISPESVYYKIKDARAAARAAERSMVDEVDGRPPDEWRTIVELVPQVLTEHSKDLEITAWLVEALARLQGFAGMRDGFRLARELVERFWDELYPMPDEDGLLTRVAPLTGLNGEDSEGTLIVPIARIPVTEGSDGAYATWQYHQAQEVAMIEDPERKQARIDGGALTIDRFQSSVLQTPPMWYADLVGDLEGCLAEFGGLCAALDERCGPDAPPSSSIRNALQDTLDTVMLVARDVLPAVVEEDPADDGVATPSDETPATARSTANALATRDDAFQQLAKVAEYFRRTEPHSPLSYMLDQAVRWGRTPLPQLLRELIPDADARSTYSKLTGIPINEHEAE